MLNQAFIIALFTYGFSSLFWERMIFQRLADSLEDNLPDWFTKPLFACPVCMVPWYGVPMYWLLWGWQVEIVPVIFMAMGINAFLSQITGNLEDTVNDRRRDITSL